MGHPMHFRFAKWACDRLTEDADFDKENHLFRWSIHWKADTPKTSHCLVQILVQRHNWAIFLRKWVRRGRYSQWRSLSRHVERIFVDKNWRGGYWQHLATQPKLHSCFAPCFWRSHYQPQSWCRLATSELWFDTVGLLCVRCRQR